jgi:hypothetical protein
MRLAPHVSIVTSSSAPPRDRASVAFGLGMKSCPRGELATTHGTRVPGPERPERLPALPVAPHRGQRRPRWIATARAHDRALTITAIPDAEIRTYVRTVQGAERASRRTYVSALHN